jgi:pSer/pThr/pTyr-binding forkhead associated (FHA) protein
VPLVGNLVSIGRSSDNTLILDEEFVSDHHARLRVKDDGWWLEDLSSTNGTWVKGERLTLARPIKVGWLFGIGDVVVEVR